jgi:hypothetical protein
LVQLVGISGDAVIGFEAVSLRIVSLGELQWLLVSPET